MYYESKVRHEEIKELRQEKKAEFDAASEKNKPLKQTLEKVQTEITQMDKLQQGRVKKNSLFLLVLK